MNRYIVMQNDRPLYLLAQGTPETAAYEYAAKLQREHPVNAEIRQRMKVDTGLFDRVVFHIQDVTELNIEPPEPPGFGSLMLLRSLESGNTGR